jgi:hypothetical protein
MPHPNISNLAWAAGILDGEGCLCIAYRKSPGNHQMWVRVVSVDNKMAPKMHELFGGSLWIDKQKRYIWQVTGKLAAATLSVVRPYLVVKGDQADICLAFGDTILANNGSRSDGGLLEVREDLRLQLQRLHQARPLSV